MASVAVTVIGRDRPGIIAEVTGVVADLGGDLEDSSMTLLRGHFAWTLIANLDVPADELTGRLSHLAADGLVVSVLPVGPETPRAEGARSYVLSVHGANRMGIVAGVTQTLAKHGGNITDLSTRLGAGGLYLLVAEVTFPPGVDVVALGAQLAEAGRHLGVGVSLRPAEPDVL